MITMEVALRRSFGPAPPPGLTTGLNIHEEAPTPVPWPGPVIDGAFVAARLGAFAWTIVPFGLAVRLFDRFDPGRARGRSPKPRELPEAASERREAASPSLAWHPSATARPSLAGAVLAEARLVWDSTSWVRWPLLAAAVAAPFAPGEAQRFVAGAFFLLLVPAVSEAAARETLAGTRALVWCQPALPRAPLLWKLLAVLLFVGALAAPFLVRSLLFEPRAALTLALGLVFTAAFAVGAASLTGGGKLFTGVYLVLWYGALNGAAPLDFAGALSGQPNPAVAAAFAMAGAALAGSAAWAQARSAR
jgi:hypothetical protein